MCQYPRLSWKNPAIINTIVMGKKIHVHYIELMYILKLNRRNDGYIYEYIS